MLIVVGLILLAILSVAGLVAALGGGIGVGYLSLQLHESAVVVGTGVGLLLGVISGFGMGFLMAVLWWRRLARTPSEHQAV